MRRAAVAIQRTRDYDDEQHEKDERQNAQYGDQHELWMVGEEWRVASAFRVFLQLVARRIDDADIE
jgi:hypothetical protein